MNSDMIRVRSENDTTAHLRIPHHLNNDGVHIAQPNDTGVHISQPATKEQPQGQLEVNSNHHQFTVGSTDILTNGKSNSNTLTDNKKSGKVWFSGLYL